MKRIIVLAAMLVLTASCGTAKDDSAANPRNFALSLPVEAARDGAVQQIALPAAALVALKRADRGDIRVFDASGRPLSAALLNQSGTKADEVRFDAIPVSAPESGSQSSGVSIRVDQAGRTVMVDTAGSKPPAADGSVLFDTRKLKDPAQAVAIDADLPMQRPVTITVAASPDLTVWQPLAEQVLFRPGEGPSLLGTGRISLPGTTLEGMYLRMTWNGAPDAVVRSATIFAARTPPLARVKVPASGQALADSHHLNFTLPPGPAPSTLRIVMTGRDGIVPLRLLGRNAVDEPWTLLGVNSLKQDGNGAVLEFGDSAKHQFSLEADPRGAGFSKPPRLEFGFDPIVLLVAFNGNAPYRLAVGNSAAEPIFFNRSDLTGKDGPYPQARVDSGPPDIVIDLAGTGNSSAVTLRTLALWSALILGVLVLAIATYRLFRANSPDRV